MERYGYQGQGVGSGTLPRMGEAFVAYLRSRRAEHWVMFAAGLVLGVLLG